MASLGTTQISDTGFLQVANGNNSQRPSGLNVNQGQVRYNGEKGLFEWYNGGGWINNADWQIYNELRSSPNYTPRLLIQVEATGLNYSGTRYYRQYAEIEGTAVLNSNAPRSYRISKFRKNAFGVWEFVETQGHDVYGGQAGADSAVAQLNGFVNGELIILNTWDEPNNRRNQLIPIVEEKFGSMINHWRNDWSFRDHWLLVGICGEKKPLCEEHGASGASPDYFSLWLP